MKSILDWFKTVAPMVRTGVVSVAALALLAHFALTHLHPAPAVPTAAIDVPAQVSGSPGHHVEILATSTGPAVKWHFDGGPTAPDLLELDSGKRLIFTATTPGTYQLLCWTAVGKAPSEGFPVSVTLGNAPPGPSPGPTPGPTPSPASGPWHITVVVHEATIDAATAAAARGGQVRAYCQSKGSIYKVYDRAHPDLSGTGIGELADSAGEPAVVIQDNRGVVLGGKAETLPATEAAFLARLKQLGS